MPKGEYLQYGGQAIIEGVMMRSPRYFAVAVRAPNQEVILQTEPLEKTWIGRQQWLKLPFLRGTLALLDAMALGIRAMHFASNIQMAPKYQPDAPNYMEPASEPVKVNPGDSHALHDAASHGQTVEGSKLVEPGKEGGESIRKLAVGSAMVTGLAFGLFLFVFLPNLVGEQLKYAGVTNSTWLNFASGILKLVIFLGYVWGISRLKEIKRVFQYHGAEHKAINTLEANQELTLENCKKQTRLHPRCGTSFAIIVLIVDIIILTFVPRYLVPDVPYVVNLVVRFGINLLLLAPIAGIAYEAIRFAGKFRTSAIVNAMFAPGLATQYLTTAEPDDDQIEVALTSLRAVVEAEKTGNVEGAPEPTPEPPQAEETSESIA